MAARLLALTLSVLVLPVLPGASAAEVVKDGGFEDETNPDWDEGGVAPPICDDDCGNGGGSAGPHGGRKWAWFGGVPYPDLQVAAQQVTIPAGPASLSFWLWHGRSNGGAADLFRVFLGNDEVFRLPEGGAGFGTYKQVTVDVGRLAGGGPKELSFEYQGLGGLPTTNYSLDDVSLQAGVSGGTSVTLQGPKRVARGKKAKLKATVQPCAGHAGDVVELYRGKKRIASRTSDASCTATFKVRIKRKAAFRAVSGGVSSNKLKVRPRR